MKNNFVVTVATLKSGNVIINPPGREHLIEVGTYDPPPTLVIPKASYPSLKNDVTVTLKNSILFNSVGVNVFAYVEE